jgi:hypothetical protein
MLGAPAVLPINPLQDSVKIGAISSAAAFWTILEITRSSSGNRSIAS